MARRMSPIIVGHMERATEVPMAGACWLQPTNVRSHINALSPMLIPLPAGRVSYVSRTLCELGEPAFYISYSYDAHSSVPTGESMPRSRGR